MSKCDTFKRIAVCPYFDTAFERSVRCESPEPDSRIRLTFRTSGLCYAYVRTHCASLKRCKDCVIYQTIEQKQTNT